MKTLKDIVELELNSIPHQNKFLLGFTGGVDSTALLHVFSTISGIKVRAVHIYNNRNIHKKDEVIKSCKKLRIDIILDSFEYKFDKNVEATGRNLRYQKIQNLLEDGEIFVSAHHLDDNIENFFIRLFRGSGIDGLSSISRLRPFGISYQFRPFLQVPKEMLINYAIKNNLTWIEDPDNNDLRFTRNIIRKKILPNIENYFPHYRTTITRTIKHLTEMKSLLPEVSSKLSLENLSSLSLEEQNFVIREFVKQNTAHSISYKTSSEILKQLASKSKNISIPIKKEFILVIENHHLKLVRINSQHWLYSSRSNTNKKG